jgi:hypothetical protein
VRARSSSFAVSILVALGIIATRLPVLAVLHPSHLFATDELALLFATMDRFLGVPSNVLIWPAGPIQMLSVPVFLADFVVASHLRPSPSSYLVYWSELFREPWYALLLVRLL